MIWAANESLIYTKNINDGTFNTSTIFKTFCPLRDCLDLTNYTLTITMTVASLAGLGWQRNVLAIKQNGEIKGTFGETFINGTTSPPVYITVRGYS